MKKLLLAVMIAVFSMTMVSPASAAISQAKLAQMRETAREYLAQFEMTSTQELFDNTSDYKGGEYKVRGKFAATYNVQNGKYNAFGFEDENGIMIVVLMPAGYMFKEGTYYTFVGKNYIGGIYNESGTKKMVTFETMSLDFLPIMSEYGF